MENVFMTTAAMHRISGAVVCTQTGTLIAPTSWTDQGTGLSRGPITAPSFVDRGRLGATYGAGRQADAAKATAVARVRTGEPPV